MAAGYWYYQVWCHIGLEDLVNVVETHKIRNDALKRALLLNRKADYYTRPGFTPVRYYFMVPVLEEHLCVATAEYFSRCLNEDREKYLKTYDGYLLHFAEQMLPFIINGIKNLHGEKYWRLNDHGGNLEVCSSSVKNDGVFKCYVVYTGCDRKLLRLAWEYELRNSMVTVGLFDSEKELLAWAHDAPVATRTIENGLIDLFCDRFRNVK